MVSLLLLKNRIVVFCTVFLLLAAFGSRAYGVIIDLPITVDTHLDSRTSNGADNWNFGNDHTDKIVVNSSDSPTSICRALFELPEALWGYDTEEIISVRVYFYAWQDHSGDRGSTLYPLTTNFLEGTGTKYSQPSPVDGATWWTRDGTNAWANPDGGGDFDTNYPVAGVKDEILDPNYNDRFFYWDITALLNDPVARHELKAFGALLQMEELPYPESGVQYWAPLVSYDYSDTYQYPYLPRVQIMLPTDPVSLVYPMVTNGFISFHITNLTADATNIIERSFDLLTNEWVTVTSFTARAGTTNWSEEVPADRTNAYYRIKSLP